MSEFSDDNITDASKPLTVKCPKCGNMITPVNGTLTCSCGATGKVKVVVGTHTWGHTKTHKLSGCHFFEEIHVHPDFKDRGFGIPICARLKKALIVTATEAADNQAPYREQKTTSDDIKPVFAMHDKPNRSACCRECIEITQTFEMPASTRGTLDSNG